MISQVLVTGASGLLGGEIARRLLARGENVVPTGRRLDSILPTYVPCDLADPSRVRKLFQDHRIGAVIHAAGRIRSTVASLDEFVRDNITATAIVAEEARAAGVRRFIHISTVSVYVGDGPFDETHAISADDSYGSTKVQAEKLFQSKYWPEGFSTVLRLGGIHGRPRNSGMIHEFFHSAQSDREIWIEEPETVTTVTFFDDIIAVVERLLRPGFRPVSPVYNVATAEMVTLAELAAAICGMVGSKAPVVSPSHPRRRNRALRTDRLRAELGYEPIPLRQHLDRYLEGSARR